MYYEISILHSTFINRRSTLVYISYFVARTSYFLPYFRIKFNIPLRISPVSPISIVQKYEPTGISLP